MIERYLQNVTIRKYGTAFLEAFGMLPLTYFGCVGDNLTDNYANLQVAINESVKRELRFIFVPAGNYYYTGNLLNIDQVIFIGNEKYARIYGGENGDIKIYQIGTYVTAENVQAVLTPEMIRPLLEYAKGDVVLDASVVEDGYIDIETNTTNATEVILAFGAKKEVFKLEGGVITRNGKLFAGIPMSTPLEPDYFYLGENVYLNFIEIIENGIRIYYKLEDTSATGTLYTDVYWRVR